MLSVVTGSHRVACYKAVLRAVTRREEAAVRAQAPRINQAPALEVLRQPPARRRGNRADAGPPQLLVPSEVRELPATPPSRALGLLALQLRLKVLSTSPAAAAWAPLAADMRRSLFFAGTRA